MLWCKWFSCWLGIMILVRCVSYSDAAAINMHRTNHNGSDSFDDQVQHRYVRALLNLFSDANEAEYKMGNNSPLITALGKHDLSSTNPADTWLQLIRKQTGRVAEGATSLALTPVDWLAHMRDYWPLYVVCATILSLLMFYFYCTCQNRAANLGLKKNFDPQALLRMFRQQANLSLPSSS